jgi:hypothetical protein
MWADWLQASGGGEEVKGNTDQRGDVQEHFPGHCTTLAARPHFSVP